MSKTLRSSLLLVLAAMIWGLSFVAQSVGGEYLGSFTFNCARSLLGAVSLVPIILLRDRKAGVERPKRRNLIMGGLVCGVLLAMAVNLQQSGMTYVDTAGLTPAEAAVAESAAVGKVGFLTALYIVLVPVFGLFVGRRTGVLIWIGVLIAACGMYFLCVTESLSVGRGDLLVLMCAVTFTLQIYAVDHYVKTVDSVYLSCAQFLVCGLLSGACMFIWENPALSDLLAAWKPILYMGIMSSGIAYTLQIAGQKHTKPSVAALIMSLESVFAAVFGYLILGESLTPREGIGCALMFSAILITQVPTFGKRKKALN